MRLKNIVTNSMKETFLLQMELNIMFSTSYGPLPLAPCLSSHCPLALSAKQHTIGNGLFNKHIGTFFQLIIS